MQGLIQEVLTILKRTLNSTPYKIAGSGTAMHFSQPLARLLPELLSEQFITHDWLRGGTVGITVNWTGFHRVIFA